MANILNPKDKFSKISDAVGSKSLDSSAEFNEDGFLNCPKDIIKKSKILSSSNFVNTYEQFGLDGIKTLILQELIKLHNDNVIYELGILSTAATKSKEIKRALRAAKLLAMQWAEDTRRDSIIKERSQLIFETIPTFATDKLTGSDRNSETIEEKSISIAEQMSPLYKYPGYPLYADTENRERLLKGEILLFLTDIHGNYEFLTETLEAYGLIGKDGAILKWTAPPNIKVAVLGNLLSNSPYSIWGEKVHQDSFKVIASLRYLSQESNGKIFFCFGDYDIDIASKAIFLNPKCNFTGNIGVYTQVQAIPIMISFLKETAYVDENNPYCAWQGNLSSDWQPCFVLKDSFKIQGKPDIIIPSLPNGLPDIGTLIDFLNTLYNFLVPPNKLDMPKTFEDIDKRAAQLLPAAKPTLNLNDLALSVNRAYLFEGLSDGTGTTEFLRQSVSAINIFETDEKEIFAAHVTLKEEAIKMIGAAKTNNWNIPCLEEFIKSSKTLKTKNINPDKLIKIIKDAGFENIHQFFSLNAEEIFSYLTQNKKLDSFIPAFSARKDKQGFVDSFKKLQSSILQEDNTGLLGFRLNLHSQTRKIPILMRKLSPLDEKAFTAYCTKFIEDIFLEENILHTTNIITENRIMAFLPDNENPIFKVGIEISPDAALYIDSANMVHIPIKHIAFIEYIGSLS